MVHPTRWLADKSFWEFEELPETKSCGSFIREFDVKDIGLKAQSRTDVDSDLVNQRIDERLEEGIDNGY